MWTLIGRLYGNFSGQEFGVSVALSEDGGILSVGSVNNNAGSAASSGSISVYEIQELDSTSETYRRFLTRKRVPSNATKAPAAVGPYEMFSNYTLHQVGQTLIQGESTDGDNYGLSSSLSSAGDILAVGAPKVGNNSGKVFVYSYNNKTDEWKTISLSNATGEKGDNLGWSVAIAGDGTVLAAGAPQQLGSAHGYVNLYHLTSDVGELLNTIPSSGSWTTSVSSELMADSFGFSVSLDNSGQILAVGAPNSTVTNDVLSGGIAAVFIKDLSTSQWSLMGGKVLEGNSGDALGFSVALSSSGTRIAVGAPNTSQIGAVRIYDFSNDSWLMAPGIEGNVTGGDFGFSVSLNADGTLCAIGVPFLTACETTSYMQRSTDGQCSAGTSLIYEDTLNGDVAS